jgi:integrase
MLAKKPLTDRAVAALKPAPIGKRRLVWDAVVPGLAVRVTDKGVRTFVLVTRYPGSPHPAPRSLGTYGAITLEEARGKARAWLKLIGAGRDPSASAADDTLRAICEEYLEREGKKLRSAQWRRDVLARLVWPELGHQNISAIRRSDIVRLLDKIEDENGPVMADRTLATIRKIMNWHAARSDDFRSPIVRGMARTKPKERARERVLTDDELREIWGATDDDLFGPFVRFLLLTATRRNEAAHARHSEITGTDWTIPATRYKTGTDHVVPLSKAAQAIVANRQGHAIVFSTGDDKPISNFSSFKEALDEASGVRGWTLHDLRRTARSLMSRAGVPSDHAERCLGHVIGGVRGTYDRHAYHEEKARAFEMLAQQIDLILNPKSNVVVGLRR